eukprot:TRINITY_DN24688_c0_g1_i4.p1 TRINITY_DN24688_c0_g1~~TRINITY_DN24688_c0_g1_i4.p1  ORF type:complete len:134 (-),score=15.42 TRINITY_DN24688_c0_g1_i4:280-681(-)
MIRRRQRKLERGPFARRPDLTMEALEEALCQSQQGYNAKKRRLLAGLGPRTATSSTSSSRHHHHPGPYRAQRPAAAPANADAESDRRIAAALAAGQQAGRPISTTMRRPEKPADGRSAADSPPHPTIVSEPDK